MTVETNVDRVRMRVGRIIIVTIEEMFGEGDVGLDIAAGTEG